MTGQLVPSEWEQIRQIANRGMKSSLHCSIATINPDGSPHVTPIGTLLLGAVGKGRYLDLFASGLGSNLDRDPRFTLVIVDSSSEVWLAALEEGRFAQPPSIRLSGTAGRRRRLRHGEAPEILAFADELQSLKGYDLLWGKQGGWVRDLEFDLVKPVRIGRMTSDLHSPDNKPLRFSA